MPSAQELQFILKMRDEATASLNRVGGSLGRAGKGARGFANENRKAGHSLDGLTSKAKKAAAAVGGVFLAQKAVRAGLAAFNTYEQGMLNVQKTTDATNQQMKAFETQIDRTARRLTGIKVGNILDIAGISGQLGVAQNKIAEFAETMAKLEVASDISGAEGATNMARFLDLSGEGTDKIKEMADVLVGLGNTVKAQESEILRMGRTLAQSTKQFDLGGAALLGLGAAAAELDFRPELFSTSMQRTLIQLADAAQFGGKGMETLSKATGLSQKEFQALLREKPEEAFFRFLDVLKAMNGEGQSLTGFLTQFNLQGMETVKVLGTAASEVDTFRDRIAIAQEKLANPGSLEKEYENFTQGLVQQWDGLISSVTLLMKDLVMSVAPALKSLIGIARSVVDGVDDVFGLLPDALKPWLVGLGLAGGAMKGLAGTLRLLAPLIGAAFATTKIGKFAGILSKVGGWVLYLINPLKLVRLAFIAVTAFAQGFFGALVAGFGVIPVLIGVAIAAIAGIGIALWKNWDAVKAFFSQSWGEIGSQIVGAITGAFTSAMANAKDIWNDFWNWVTKKTIDQRAFDENIGGGVFDSMVSGFDKAMEQVGKNPVAINPNVDMDFIKSNVDVSPEQRKLIEGLDSITKAKAEVDALHTAVEALAALPKNSNFAPSAEELSRLRAQVELRRRELDPVSERLRLLDLEIADASAITAEERNRLAVLGEIRDLEEQNGNLIASQKEVVAARVRALQEAHKQTSFKEMTQDLKEQLEAAQAITRAEQNRVAILQEISAFEREHEQLKAEQRKEVERLLAATQQVEQFNSLRSSLDPQGSAIQTYKDDLATLKAEFESGRLSAEKYNAMVAQLNRSTLNARDPFAGQMQSLERQMELLRIGGDYKDADTRTQQTINQLIDQGVSLTQEQVTALSAANRQLQEMEKSQNSGLTGWMNSVGTLKDNLMDMTKDFAGGLSDAIAGALEGKRGGFTALLRKLASNMISTGVNQTMKILMEGAQGASGKGGPGGIGGFIQKVLGIGGKAAETAAPVANAATDALSNMVTGAMTVNAATVLINGSPLGMPGSGLPGDIGKNGSVPGTSTGGEKTFGIGPQDKVVRQALAPIQDAGKDVAANINTSGWNLRGSIDSVSNQLRGSIDAIDKSVTGLRGTFDGSALGITRSGETMTKAWSDMANANVDPGQFSKMISLSPKEITDLKKTLMTEWVPSQGDMQGKGILDTILNRKASGKWGDDIKSVVDARKQFSDINGPIAWKKGRHSVDDIADSALLKGRGQRASDLVDRYLPERAAGAPSSVSDHLNYANRAHSTPNNFGWIDKLEGPKFGGHQHGTTADLERFRPGDFGVSLPKETVPPMNPSMGMMPSGMGGLGGMGGAANPQIQQLTQQWQQQMQTANTTIATQMPQVFQQPMQNVGQQFAQVFQQGGAGLQQLGPQIAQIGQAAQAVVPNLDGMGQGLNSLLGPLTNVIPNLGDFKKGFQDAMSSILGDVGGGAGGGGGGFGGIFSILKLLFGGLFHEGSDFVGAGHPASGYRALPASTWASAVKHHKGLKGVEYPAILKRGEKVLTANDNKRNSAVIEGLTDRLEGMQKAAANGGRQRFGNTNVNQNFTIVTPDANSFRKSEGQLMADSSTKMRRVASRNT